MNENIKKVINKKAKVHNIEMNSYVAPSTSEQLNTSGKYITNGVDNAFYRHIEDRYNNSTTNAAVIDAYASYIYGKGLKSNIMDIDKIVNKNDVRLMIKDLKKHGGFTFQVVYSKDKKSIAKIYHLPIRNIAIVKQDDLTTPVETYVYCFDWTLKTKFKPYPVPAFGFGEKVTEIKMVNIPSDRPLFPLPDWLSAVQFCQVEEELSNFYINHIKNNFSAGKLININQGVLGESDEEIEATERAIVNKFTGSVNAGRTVVSINENAENATTIEDINIQDAYSNFQYLSNEARDKILMSHKVTNPILFGVKDGTGFGNNADEMVVALKSTYRAQINPLREIFIDGLTEVLRINNENVELYFEDFDELNTDTTNDSNVDTNVDTNVTLEELATYRFPVTSSNARELFYDDKKQELVIRFNDNSFYTYFKVDNTLFQAILAGAGVCTTTGKNEFGSWYIGKTPSVGAAIHQLLINANVKYRRGASFKI